MKKRILLIMFAIFGCLFFLACGKNENVTEDTTLEEEKLIVIGFSQLGAESDWRSSNTLSMLNTFTEENGYQLIFDDGQQSQTNQITAIRRFIQQGVDYIVLAPVTEDGWDTVLSEAKEAGIPVVIVDRMVNVKDDSLYTCWVGSDFELEGKKAAEWLNEYAQSEGIAPEELHIVDLQGNIGASAQIGRTKGLEGAAEKYGWNILAEESAEFTQTKGKEVMTKLLKEYDDINVVYCENDNSALGAIEAIEAAGKKVGLNIKEGEILIISFDGVNEEAVSDVVDGKIACIAECNPLHGPRVELIIKTLATGSSPAKKSYVNEEIYSATDKVSTITVEGVNFDVTHLTDVSQTQSKEITD